MELYFWKKKSIFEVLYFIVYYSFLFFISLFLFLFFHSFVGPKNVVGPRHSA
jgi:hypothetical protein